MTATSKPQSLAGFRKGPTTDLREPGPIESLLNEMLGNKDTVRRLQHSHFARQLTEGDSDLARNVNAAKRLGLNIRHQAMMGKIDIDGDHWVSDTIFGEAAQALKATFNDLAVSPAYRAWQSERTAALVNSLAASPFFRHIARTWENATPLEHTRNARWISTRHQMIFAHGIIDKPHAINVGTFSQERTGPRLVRGEHARSDPGSSVHTLRINVHPDAEYHHPARGLNVVFHENTHAVHHMLGAALADGAIANDHPLHADARTLLAVTFDHLAYLPGIKNLYQTHPTEEDTFRASDDFIDRMETALAPHGVTLYPHGKPAP